MTVYTHGHIADHDPVIDHDICETCNAALRAAFVFVADLPLGPRDASTLVDTIRRAAGTILGTMP